ncbi:FAD/NAD(P)-binding protein [Mangrovivirga sp. M17]|uniref:FAD/NAD(P)-binding protein n=1 Tax=Mangrovivirga halotolerans TaxID=2993936 RepID=A0ABT3RNC4_9BACT|nr:FAD/NAD(P)-binding protein [Mangrovivirga halotolerans]
MTNLKTIAIVGCGPRGLHAIEKLLQKLSQKETENWVNILVFEKSGNFGNGQIYSTDQSVNNWLNLPLREIKIKERPDISLLKLNIKSFPSFHNWANIEKNDSRTPDEYPTRAKVGEYLQERFQSLFEALNSVDLITKIPEEVIDANISSDNIQLITSSEKSFRCDHAALALGHLPVEPSDQIKKWMEHCDNIPEATLFTSPYPVSKFDNPEIINHRSIIGIRGYGLSMIDVMRELTDTRGGSFHLEDSDTIKLRYQKGKYCPKKIVPFSLDGLPPAPKPINKYIDDKFKPSERQLNKLINNIEAEISDSPGDLQFIFKHFSPLVAEIFIDLDKLCAGKKNEKQVYSSLITTWLKDDDHEHELILSKKIDPVTQIESFIDMATGNSKISLDYCIGQVWRHCQHTFYQLLSYRDLPQKVYLKFIDLNERIKRYSYGPPVESMQQQLALIKAGVMDLTFVKNPEINLTENGWQFEKNGKSISMNIVADTVLSPPQLIKTKSPLLQKLLKANHIVPYHKNLGANTKKSGLVIPGNNENNIPLAILGRLSIGKNVGVDSIHESFNGQISNWAKRMINDLLV